MFGAMVGMGASVFAVAFIGLTLWSPDGSVVHIEMTGTGDAPEARGVAVLTETGSGLSIELDVEGLDPASDGSYYQAWMVGERGMIPVGSFHVRGTGDGITLWSGVSVDDYPGLTVTLRTVDDPQATGDPVLSGELDG